MQAVQATLYRQCSCSARSSRSTQLIVRAYSSGFIGVREDEDSGSFQSVIVVDGSEVHGGTFSTAEEAARSYDMLVRVFEDGSAKTNFAVAPAVDWDQEKSEQEHLSPSIFPVRPRCAI
jgi:hypothetical protein